MILRARTILPITAPPIEDGAVAISGNQICAIGTWKDLKSQFPSKKRFDLGEVILLPGLVNAHCHLDYTDMAGLWSPPKKFTDWISQMLAAKAAWSYTDYARSWLNGAKMLLQTGTTTVADIEAVPELLPEMWDATPLRIFSFLEMTGIRSKREPEQILGEAMEKINLLTHPRCLAALSPHAPYSTSPELLQLCARIVRGKKLRVATHVAESEQEFEMFAHARGEMFNWLKKNGRDMSDCGHGSPVQHLHQAGLLGENLLAIHVNCLAPNDVELLNQNRVHVIHCPHSHDYFQHPPFPRKQLADAGVNICLGTDSLATTRKNGKDKPTLNLFSEMQSLAAKDKTMSAEEILQMATVNGARALGMSRQIGELSENAFADLIAIPFRGKNADIFDAVVHHASTVSASMIDGKWAIAP
jgi:cytosine/adenosine deaminase-related metal-dependent hydrolase